MEAPKRPTQRPSGQRLTRKRVPLSCVACRIRKLKCNREKPCQNCIVRGESNAVSCTYADKAGGKHLAKLNPRSNPDDMRQRIDRLEKSILSVISTDASNVMNKPGSPAAHVTDDEQTDEDDNPHEVGQKISVDTRSTHWDAILNEVRAAKYSFRDAVANIWSNNNKLGAMKDAWSEENDGSETSSRHQSSKNFRPSLLTGLTQPPKRSVVMASLPFRDAADKLVNRFFTYVNPAVPAKYIIHQPTFLKEYKEHWADPSKTKTIWIGLLFGVFCHALQSYRRTDSEPPEYRGTMDATINLYRLRAAQCLTITNVTKPVKYMIETMLVYSMTEYADESDEDMGTWLLSGYVLRLALQQGYHRDPSQHPNISIFDAEMRRRIWCCVAQHELLFSVKVGLPKGIRYSECDSMPPRNLNEDELFEEMSQLPPARPNNEPTDLSYFVVKHRIMEAYGRVIEFLHIIQPQPYDEVLRIDTLVREALESVPHHLRLYSFEAMQNIPPHQIMESCMINAFSHKAVCLLHRKYWNDPENVQLNNYSRGRCVGSSIVLLEQQAAMHHACRAGGILSDLKWYHFAIINHDFLLAAVIICLDLMMISRKKDAQLTTDPEAREKISAIMRSRSIWEEVVGNCRDAKRAVTILSNAINKLPDVGDEKSLSSTPVTRPDLTPANVEYTIAIKPEVSTPVSAIPNDGYDTIMQENLPSSEVFFDNLVSDPNLTTNFDWDGWDQFLASQPLGYDIKVHYS